MEKLRGELYTNSKHFEALLGFGAKLNKVSRKSQSLIATRAFLKKQMEKLNSKIKSK